MTLQRLPAAANPLRIDEHQREQFRLDLAYWKASTIVLGPMNDRPLYLAYLTAMLRREPTLTGGVYLWRNVRLDERQPSRGTGAFKHAQPRWLWVPRSG